MTDEELALRICNAGARAVGFDEFADWPNLRGTPCIRALAELDEARALLIPEMAELRAELAALKARPVACEPLTNDELADVLEAWVRAPYPPGDYKTPVQQENAGFGQLAKMAAEAQRAKVRPVVLPTREELDAAMSSAGYLANTFDLADAVLALLAKPAPAKSETTSLETYAKAWESAELETRSLRERLEEAREIISQHQASDEAWKIAQKSWQERAEKAEREHSELVGRYGACKLRLADADRELAECKAERDGAKTIQRQAVVKLWKAIEGICGEGADGESVVDTAIRILREQKAQLEAREAIKRGAESEERATQQAQAAGLSAIRRAVNELRAKGAYLLADHLCGWANEQDRVPQPEKDGK